MSDPRSTTTGAADAAGAAGAAGAAAGGAVPSGDQARVSAKIEVPPAAAFRIFTEDIDRWWRRGLKYRVAGARRGFLHLEPGVGGRVYESFETPAGTKIFETGQITAWEPPARLCFRWRAANFTGDEATEVEVQFAPSGDGTLVTVTHRGWSKIRPDHPARHGLAVSAFLRMIGLWWGELMATLRDHARATPPTAGGGEAADGESGEPP
jgi:uncharacterized protein YndB with AHSA1/START domain